MTLPQIISRNQIQKIPEISLTGRVVLQPNTWYTCPTGKKAIVKGSIVCTGRGAAATADFTAAGILLFRWDKSTIIVATETWNYRDTPLELTTHKGGQTAFFEVQLAAGETILTDQNSGSNAEFNLLASVLETPA